MIAAKTYSEAELVEGLLQQDQQAFSYLYDHYSRALFNIIYQSVQDNALAEDVLQQVFVKIWKGIPQYNAGKGRLFTWMLNIARNQAIDTLRSKQFNKDSKTISLPENVYEQQATTASIRDAGLLKVLEKLPSESRRLLQLAYFSGYTQEEIARILELPLGTVKSRLRSIIIQLRKQVIE